ncbi:MAG: hypothetical protein H6735_09490 [Alphaproteobacteria bacterium]|nr:hypothetical protein [Alphaproteobacteria bacterium]
MPDFCGPFDRALASSGAPAVFLFDTEGLLRFDPEWTRDAWQRVGEATPRLGTTWWLARDRASGYVLIVMATSPDLLAHHPRLDVRAYPDHASARAAREALGHPPIAPEPW